MKCLLARKSRAAVWEFDEGDVVLEGCARAAVARVLHEVIREEDLAARLVPVQVVHSHISVGAVGTAGKMDKETNLRVRGDHPIRDSEAISFMI